MDLLTEVHQYDFPRLLSVFNSYVPENHWRKRVSEIKQQVRGNRFLEGYLESENKFVIALCWMSDFKKKYGHLNFRIDEIDGLYEASAFVAQFSHMCETLTPKNANHLSRRVYGGLKNPRDMRALFFEMQVATNFRKQGFSVEFPEEKGRPVYDLLVRREAEAIEVECKLISEDKGRLIHTVDAMDIFGLIHKSHKSLLNNVVGGIVARIFINDRIPTNYSKKNEICSALKSEIFGVKVVSDQFEIEISAFSIEEADAISDEESFRSFLKKIGMLRRNTVLMKGSGGGALVVAIESRRPDKTLREMFVTASDAAKNQLTGNAPGLICLKIEGVSGEQLREIGREVGSPTALRKEVSRFLDSGSASNATAVVFLADDVLELGAGSGVTKGMAAYSFFNEKNRFSDKLKKMNCFSSLAS